MRRSTSTAEDAEHAEGAHGSDRAKVFRVSIIHALALPSFAVDSMLLLSAGAMLCAYGHDRFYPGATWVGPMADGNFEAGRSNSVISHIVLHTAEVSMATALSKFQTSVRKVSSHYIVGTNGTIWQAVSDADTAYHCGNLAWNRKSIGIELEGWANGKPAGDFSWQTVAQRTAVENLIRWLHVQYRVPLDRAHILGHNQIPSPGGSFPPSTNWGGGNSHWDPGAWFDWGRILTDLGHVPVFTPLTVQTATSILTLPSSDAPIITPAVVGQKFVAYDLYNGYYLVFVTGQELAQKSIGSGEYHWDGWIPASSVSVESNALQLEVTNAFPHLCPVYDRPSLSATVIAHTIDGKRYVATGKTAFADGCTWREFYIARAGGTIATAWAVADAFAVVGKSTRTLALSVSPRAGGEASGSGTFPVGSSNFLERSGLLRPYR